MAKRASGRRAPIGTQGRDQIIREPRRLIRHNPSIHGQSAYGVVAAREAHAALFLPRALSAVACPAQRQSAEAVRRVREAVLKAGGKLAADNVYGLELTNGSRVLARG